MFNYSMTLVHDADTGLTYMYISGASDSVSALGGYTLSFNVSCLVDGQWASIQPMTIKSLAAWDLFDANLANNTVSAISAEGLSLSAETNSVGLFSVLLPGSIDASSDLLVCINQSGNDLVFDQYGVPIDVDPSLQYWDGSSPSPAFIEIHSPTLVTPSAASYTDTPADDTFAETIGTLAGVDSDGDSLTYGISGGHVTNGISSKTGNYGTLSVNTVTGAYIYAPTDSTIEGIKENTSESFVVTVSDGFSTDESTLVVNLAGADDATKFDGTLTGSVEEDGGLAASGTLTVFDRDVGDSAITAQSNTLGIYGTFSIGVDGRWSYLLDNHATIVQALSAGQIKTDTFAVITAGGATHNIEVIVNGTNDAPTVANPIPDQTVAEDSAFSYTFVESTFNDVDAGDTFTYTASLSGGAALPTWLTFDGYTRTFSGTPTDTDVGYYDIAVTASDSSDLTDTDTFRITVNNVNDAPTGTVTISGTPIQGQALTAGNDLADADGLGVITYTWYASGSMVSIGTGESLVLTQAEVGKTITVTASYTDGYGTFESKTSAATDAVANLNESPALAIPTAPAFFNTAANDTFATASGTLVATDPDNDTLTYGVFGGGVAGGFASLVGTYGTLTVSVSTGAWSYTPDDAAIEAVNANATDNFTVTVSDGLLDASQPFTVNLIAIPAPTAKYFVLAGSGANYIDYNLQAGSLSLQGQYTVEAGTSGVDAIHVRPGTAVDFTLSGSSADKVYLDGGYGNYEAYLSGSIVTLVRGSGASQELVRVTRGSNLVSSDVLVFADGSVSTWDLYNLLKSGTPLPDMGSETSIDALAPAADGSVLSATVKAFSLDSTGETFAPVGHGMHLVAVGSTGVDNVYVGDGSSVDATPLGASTDNIYFRGSWSDYDKSLAGSVMTFTRTVNSEVETVKVYGGTGGLNDRLIFADGAVLSFNAKTALQGNINVAINAVTGYDATNTTPGLHPTLQSSALDNVTNLDVTSDIVLNYDQSVTAVAGKYIHIINDGGTGFHGEASVHTQDILVTDTAQVTISGGKVTLNPTFDLDLANNYHITIDKGAFTATATGLSTAAFDGTTSLNFSTVTPGTSSLANAAASQAVDSNGAMVASYSWLDIEGIGSPSAGSGMALDLAGGKYALVAKDYDANGADSNAGYDGIRLGDLYVAANNFAKGDLLYIDDQGNNLAQLNDLSLTLVAHEGSPPTTIQFAGISLGGFLDVTLSSSPATFDSIAALDTAVNGTAVITA